MKHTFSKTILATAVALAASQVVAQDQSVDEEVVVTGTFSAAGSNPLEASISVSSVSFEDAKDFAPTNTAEIYRSLPGIRSESSSGGGNSNVAVRGLPLSTGGAKFLQTHEDGLPVMLFGDFDFSPADAYVKVDSTLDRVESVRGGTASTLTTNGAGGIINMIGKTGKDEGGSAALTLGTDHDNFRIDIENGGSIGESSYFHIGGHFEQGGDIRDTGYDTVSGGQIRVALTKEYDNGYIRVIAKNVDKKDAAYFPQPLELTGSATTVDGISYTGTTVGDSAGTLDATDSLYSPYIRYGVDYDGGNNRQDYDLADGITSKVSAIGVELSFDLGNGIQLDNKMRKQDISGDFNGAFTNNVNTVSNGGYAGATRYNGPNAGDALAANDLVANIAYFHVGLDDMGNFANDLRLTKSFGNLDATLGYFYMNQKFVQDWHWSSFLTTVENEAVRVSVPGQTTDGTLGFNNGFGWDGNNRNYNLDLTATAPYFGLSWSNDSLSIDGSIRQDNMKQVGVRNGAVGVAIDVNADGTIDPAESAVSFNNGVAGPQVNFETDNTAYSFGANYLLSDSMSIFGRISSGASFNSERRYDSAAILAGGVLADGGDDEFVDEVDQLELGWKMKGESTDLYVTFFSTDTEESNSSLTAGGTATAITNEYESTGLEIEANYNSGAFDLYATATFTDAEISASDSAPETVGNTPQRQADLIYTITPTYTGESFRVGASLVGTSDSYSRFNNVLEQEGYSVIHVFGAVSLAENLELSLNINNITDESGITESDNDNRTFDTDGDGVRDHTVGRSIAGTTSSLKLTYSF